MHMTKAGRCRARSTPNASRTEWGTAHCTASGIDLAASWWWFRIKKRKCPEQLDEVTIGKITSWTIRMIVACVLQLVFSAGRGMAEAAVVSIQRLLLPMVASAFLSFVAVATAAAYALVLFMIPFYVVGCVLATLYLEAPASVQRWLLPVPLSAMNAMVVRMISPDESCIKQASMAVLLSICLNFHARSIVLCRIASSLVAFFLVSDAHSLHLACVAGLSAFAFCSFPPKRTARETALSWEIAADGLPVRTEAGAKAELRRLGLEVMHADTFQRNE